MIVLSFIKYLYRQTGQESSIIQTVMFMSVSGKVIKQMGMGSINIKMGLDMRVYGKTTCSMGRELRLG